MNPRDSKNTSRTSGTHCRSRRNTAAAERAGGASDTLGGTQPGLQGDSGPHGVADGVAQVDTDLVHEAGQPLHEPPGAGVAGVRLGRPHRSRGGPGRGRGGRSTSSQSSGSIDAFVPAQTVQEDDHRPVGGTGVEVGGTDAPRPGQLRPAATGRGWSSRSNRAVEGERQREVTADGDLPDQERAADRTRLLRRRRAGSAGRRARSWWACGAHPARRRACRCGRRWSPARSPRRAGRRRSGRTAGVRSVQHAGDGGRPRGAPRRRRPEARGVGPREPEQGTTG